jgi:hypothetical protein
VISLTASHVSGSTHSFPCKVDGIFVSVRLPCEEGVYEAGVCPHLSLFRRPGLL